MLMKALKQAGDTEIYRFDEPNFRLLAGSGGIENLHNVYAEYCSVPRPERAGSMSRVPWFAKPGVLAWRSNHANPPRRVHRIDSPLKRS